MNRRGFLKLSVGGVAAATAVRTFPFRVYSFPAEPVVALPPLPDEVFVDRSIFTYLHSGLNFWSNNPLLSARLTGIAVPTPDELDRYGAPA